VYRGPANSSASIQGPCHGQFTLRKFHELITDEGRRDVKGATLSGRQEGIRSRDKYFGVTRVRQKIYVTLSSNELGSLDTTARQLVCDLTSLPTSRLRR
jgi:hypothetical protein